MSILDTLITNRPDNNTYYEYTDLNRVSEAAMYVAGLITQAGYPTTISLPVEWENSDIIYLEEAMKILAALKLIRDNFGAIAVVSLPESMEGLFWYEANNMEQFLLDINALLAEVKKAWPQCGAEQAGGMMLI